MYEKKIKRFMAYSSINQIGFLLAGVLTAPSLAKLYLIVYVIASLGFIVVFLQAKPELMYITDFNPMYKSNPLFGISMVIIMFTMAGIPPLAGF